MAFERSRKERVPGFVFFTKCIGVQKIDRGRNDLLNISRSIYNIRHQHFISVAQVKLSLEAMQRISELM